MPTLHFLSDTAKNAATLSPSQVGAKVRAGWAWHRLEPSFCSAGGAGIYSRALVSPDGELAYVSDRAEGPTTDAGLPEVIIDHTLVQLQVPYDQKADAKALGAIWVPLRKTWACAPAQLSTFARWISGEPVHFDLMRQEDDPAPARQERLLG